MTVKHTPGPWFYAESEVGTPFVDSESVGDLSAVALPIDEQKANARLIAAAPDLLAALRTAEASLADIGDADREPDVEWCERRAAEALPLVRAAIAKARGKG